MNTKNKKNNQGLFAIISLIVILSLLTILIQPEEYKNFDNGDSNNYSTNKLNTSFLKISNVSVTSNSSYAICSGTITVSSYSPYKYHFIKVKGAFKDSYGTTIDTDWTYAIGNEWLEPGESTKFRLSVDKDYQISKCDVTILED